MISKSILFPIEILPKLESVIHNFGYKRIVVHYMEEVIIWSENKFFLAYNFRNFDLNYL